MLRTLSILGVGFLLGNYAGTQQGKRMFKGLAKAALVGSEGVEGALLGVAEKMLSTDEEKEKHKDKDDDANMQRDS